MSVERLLSRLDGVRSTAPDRWISRCPAHDDRRASLSVRELPDQTVLVHCFSGCSAADVVQSVGLEFRDLFAARDHHAPPQRRPFDVLQVLLCLRHEAFVTALIAEAAASLSIVGSDRLRLACARINSALDALGALPEAPEMRPIRRGEVRL